MISDADTFTDFSFDLLNLDDDPALLQNGEKRDQLKVGDLFNSPKEI